MSLFISSLNSGSNGNCYYIGNEKEAILVDAGISCREIDKRMKRLNLPVQNIKAIFISHEHTDHTRGIYSLVKKYQLPVYITGTTMKFSGLKLDNGFLRSFSAYVPVTIGDMSIIAFPKAHDAADPYSFTVSCGQTRVGVFTDIGYLCEHVKKQFSECNAVFLEANYDELMLEQGSYPYHLKKRIRGGQGHLSNKQALDLFNNHRSSALSHLLLSHLSKNNNCPKLVSELFNTHANGTKIIVASRFEETPVYHVQSSGIRNYNLSKPDVKPSQMQFAFT